MHDINDGVQGIQIYWLTNQCATHSCCPVVVEHECGGRVCVGGR